MPASRFNSLDGLRGIAIALVFVHNCNVIGARTDFGGHLFKGFVSIGWAGVTLFFVLSGFLITRSLRATSGSPEYLRAFFGRRVLRILPVYYLTLAVIFVLWPLAGTVAPLVREDQSHQIWYWLFLTNWTHYFGLGGGALPHFWSLAVEEQFYLIWPFVVRGTSARRLLVLCACLAVLSLLLRVVFVTNHAPIDATYQFTVSRMDALALGAAVAVLTESVRFRAFVALRIRLLLVAALAIFCLGSLIPKGYRMDLPAGETAGFTLMALVLTLLVTACLAYELEPGVRRPAWLEAIGSAPLRTLGLYSYAFYAFHVPLHLFVGLPLLERLGWRENISLSGALLYLAALGALTVGVAWISWHLIEKRCLALKHRFVARPPTPGVPLPGGRAPLA